MNREPGFYWVKRNIGDEWESAEWCDFYSFWLLTGITETFDSNELFDIDERRITREEQ